MSELARANRKGHEEHRSGKLEEQQIDARSIGIDERGEIGYERRAFNGSHHRTTGAVPQHIS